MTEKLPPEIRDAIQRNPDQLWLEDEQTHAVYAVVDEQTYRRAMRALQEQEDWNAVQQGLKQREQGLGQPLAEVDAEIREEFNFPPRA
ncbi:MAG: hypothetical protein IID44_10710 [Planctomycetes bacterium]|nr:hypothetical protein [Planctomycetota bacterium]